VSAETLKERIGLELNRSAECQKAAELLFSEKLYSEVISRAYYAMMHAARAILLIKNIETSTHKGLVTMFALHFIKEEEIEEKYGKLLKRAAGEREEGDYEVTRQFTKEEAAARIEESKEFVQRIKNYLKK